MKFNTAVFYDIENLIKGYGFSDEIMQGLSLKEIFTEISSYENIGKIAVQRAYANWSDRRLQFMRNEIIELGIEPIQIFGFSKGITKNAADIQLAIDAIDLSHIRPAIDTYVIVSGDGGFASLAKKLHEYGKTVVGCAYPKTTNKTFKAVSDHFIEVEDPESVMGAGSRKKTKNETNGKLISNPLVLKMAGQLKPLPANSSKEKEVLKIKEVIDWLAKDPSAITELKQEGLNLSVLKEALNYAITDDIDTIRFGQIKFIDFARLMTQRSPIAVFRKEPSFVRLGLRKIGLKGYDLMEELQITPLHSAPTYRKILGYTSPSFRLPTSKEVLYEVIQEIVNIIPFEKNIGDLIEDIAGKVSEEFTQEDIKYSILTLVAGDCFERTPKDTPLSEQILQLKPSYHNAVSIWQKLKALFIAKIEERTGEQVNMIVLEELI